MVSSKPKAKSGKIKLAYQARIYANPGKVKQLEFLLYRWNQLVNQFICELWDLNDAYKPPEIYGRCGSTWANLAAAKAWQLVTAAKRARASMPLFDSNSLELTEILFTVDFAPTTTKFDGWLRIRSTEKYYRISYPFKQYRKLREWLAQGKLSKSVHLYRRSDGKWFAKFFVTHETQPSTATQRIGIDVGYNIATATSTGELQGQDLEALQRRIKWRTYRRNADKPYRQGLNRVARELIAANPGTDFAVEKLDFKQPKPKKGQRKKKPKRPKVFRTRLSRWAYQHLARRLEVLGKLECFAVIPRNPAYTSQS